jgi:hypothetical protein
VRNAFHADDLFCHYRLRLDGPLFRQRGGAVLPLVASVQSAFAGALTISVPPLMDVPPLIVSAPLPSAPGPLTFI